jgi:Fur family ferric uptake transcriptional regulator
MTTEDLVALFRAYLKSSGLKSTRQREEIATVLLGEVGVHLTLEEMHGRVRVVRSSIGFSTVYRTVKLLVSAGLLEEHRFGGTGQARYEVTGDREHHDHLICVRCDTIVEYEEEEVEALQEAICERHGFIIVDHRHEIYGICPACQKA